MTLDVDGTKFFKLKKEIELVGEVVQPIDYSYTIEGPVSREIKSLITLSSILTKDFSFSSLINGTYYLDTGLSTPLLGNIEKNISQNLRLRATPETYVTIDKFLFGVKEINKEFRLINNYITGEKIIPAKYNIPIKGKKDIIKMLVALDLFDTH